MEKTDNRRFISFEGIDFSGKSTQIALLRDWLQRRGFEVYILREPGGTEISEKIRRILLDKDHSNMTEHTEIFLYSAARAQLVQEKIIPLLRRGAFVIADRYVDSTTAYQGYGRGIDLDVVAKINQAATYGLMPGTTFLLDLTPQQAEERRRNGQRSTDRMEEGGREFFERIYNGYRRLARQEPERFVVIDAMQPIEPIHRQIVNVIKTRNKIQVEQ